LFLERSKEVDSTGRSEFHRVDLDEMTERFVSTGLVEKLNDLLFSALIEGNMHE
jgi:hypothetical protein